MLAYLIDSEFEIPDGIKYFDIEKILAGLTPDVLDIYKKSGNFPNSSILLTGDSTIVTIIVLASLMMPNIAIKNILNY